MKTLNTIIIQKSQEMPLFSPIDDLHNENNEVITVVYKAYQNIFHVIFDYKMIAYYKFKISL